MDDSTDFAEAVAARIRANAADAGLIDATAAWMDAADRLKYEYNFRWLGMPVIQYPQDLLAYQELIWRIRPRWIVETGIARGGSIVFAASMLELLGEDGRVVAVDIDIRPHNRERIEKHPMSGRIHLIEGSSIDPQVVEQVKSTVQGGPVLVSLDSNHTHDHVLSEMRAYSPLVSDGSYLIVCDTSIANLDGGGYADRPWSKTDNPMTAVRAFLDENHRFVVDDNITNQLMITSNPGGFLRCVRSP